MPLTNDFHAPDVFLKAIRGHPYSMGDAHFSVTGLIGPPQVGRLRKQHRNQIVSDVRDEVWKLLGSGVHAVLEGHGDGLTEQRFFAECDGIKISGAVDHIKNGQVSDYKVTSVWSTLRGVNPNWEAQLNMYAWLMRQNDMEAKSLQIVVICRDWMKSRADQDNYPSSPIVPISIPMWSNEEQQDFITERIRVHTAENTIECTAEERWARGAYKVVSVDDPRTTAGKRYDTIKDAAAYINKRKTGHFKVVDADDVKYVRCESWCEVADFLWQGEQNDAKK